MNNFLRKQTIVLILTVSFISLSLHADEGMWLLTALDRLPMKELKKRGLKLTPSQIYNANGVSLKDAIVQLGGGTGEFVSPDGLMLTNHHVAYGSLQSNSTPEKDYIKGGFYAVRRDEELPAKNYTASIVEEMRDVTSEIRASYTEGMKDAARDSIIRKKSEEIVKAATEGKKDLRANVQEMNNGQQYILFVSRVIRDVRLVYAPPLSIGNYGGEVDNWMWPRHTGDFSFMRAYVAKDGSSADFSKDNVPFKPKAFLKISKTGVSANDFVMIMGFPGRTARYRTSYEIRYDEHVTFPMYVKMTKANIDASEAAQKRDKATEIKYASRVKSMYNGYKNRKGMIEGFKKKKLAVLKEENEKEFGKWILADANREQKYGDILPSMKKIYEDITLIGYKQSAYQSLVRASTLMSQAIAIAKWQNEQRKPNAEREEGFHAKDSSTIKTRISQKTDDAELDEMAFGNVLAVSASNLIPERLAVVLSIGAKKEGSALDQHLKNFAKRTHKETALADAEERIRLLRLSPEAFEAVTDPLLDFAIDLEKEASVFSRQYNESMKQIDKLRARYIEALAVWKNAYLYPDANRTLRLTHGIVKAYKPRDAMSYEPFTSLKGVIEKDTGEEPFDAPIQLSYLHEKQDFADYASKSTRDVPVAFLSNTDITGGNSGSPVLNGKGELVGCAFDGVYEGLLNDFKYDESYSRTISVDSRYILFILDKFSNARSVLDELTVVK